MKIKNVKKTEEGTGEIDMEYAEETFKELLAFQGYGFCLGYDAIVNERSKGSIPIGRLMVGDFILCPNSLDGDCWQEVLNVIPQGKKEAFYISFDNGTRIVATLDHKFLCSDLQLRNTSEIINIYADSMPCEVKFKGNTSSRITSVEYIGEIPVMDITISGDDHLFYANNIVVHNCKAHATSYSVYSAVQMWLQEHFFDEYMCALLRHIDRAKEKKGVGVLNERIEYCMKHGMTVRYPDVTTSTDKWELRAGTMYAPLKNIKGFSDKDVSNIISNREERPFVDLKDFLDRTKFNHNKFETLLFANALSTFGDVEYLYNWYYNHYLKDKEKEKEREKKEKKEKKKKKKDESQLSLFEDEFSVVVEEEEDSSSEVPEIIKKFTASELEDKCLDINGFVIHENIQNQYHEYFEQGMAKVAEVKHDESYNSPKRRIWKLSDIMQEEVEEDKFKNRWVLAKVISEARGLMSKFGNKTFDKIVINDGYESVTIMGRIPKDFKKGNVMVFPVSIINGKVHIDHYTLEKFDALILETAEDQGEKI